MLHLWLKQTPHNEKVKNKLEEQNCCFTNFKTSVNSNLTLIWSKKNPWVKIVTVLALTTSLYYFKPPLAILALKDPRRLRFNP